MFKTGIDGAILLHEKCDRAVKNMKRDRWLVVCPAQITKDLLISSEL
ncbi:MAG: hypothetical protein H0U45_07265 [Tatlockia sp.]|nr:hypothetical protein [Tatlockia sp.]